MNLDDALQTFLAEGRELLDEMERALLSLREVHDGAEAVNAIFRAAHTIKGSAGLFGLDHIVAFTHVAESVLDEVRSGGIAIDDALLATLLACGDHIRALLDAVEQGRLEPDPALARRAEPLLEQLQQRLGTAGTAGAAALPAERSDSFTRVQRNDSDADTWHISLRFGRSVLRNGMDPLSFIRYLGTLGSISAIVALPDAIPAAPEMDPECCYLGFEIAFRSQADKATIESVFEFVLDDCAIRILPPNSRIDEYIELINALPEEPVRVGEMLVHCGTLTPHELTAALHVQSGADPAASAGARADGTPAQKIGAILVEQGSVPPAVMDAALDKQQRVREAKAKEGGSVRVDAHKLDRLIDLVGELIIASASASLAARSTPSSMLHEAHSTLSGLVEEVRDSALQLRMVKIGATFSRFQRVVHDVSREIGKDIRLAVLGEDTELDKTVVEKIADPLTHLVRNAMDHGIEAAELRAQRGKPVQGTVQLNAYHDSGTIVIEVSDDGGGLNRDRILAKAVERGLVEAGRNLSDGEIYALVFEPGFSTAEQITNLSGRGVGMDVVKRNITALRGTVAIDSVAGTGTTVKVRLPLTLAIIDGFQVGVGKSVFVVPLDMVEECLEFPAETGHDYTNLRGGVLPFIRLRELFEIEGPVGSRQNIVVVRLGAQKVGLVVDTLLGEFQTVIKPLSRMFSQVKGISGSSIRGSGEVALILDVPGLMRHVTTPLDKGASPAVFNRTIASI
jgi:two-component system chemotaxis sensor kinase CheA